MILREAPFSHALFVFFSSPVGALDEEATLFIAQLLPLNVGFARHFTKGSCRRRSSSRAICPCADFIFIVGKNLLNDFLRREGPIPSHSVLLGGELEEQGICVQGFSWLGKLRHGGPIPEA